MEQLNKNEISYCISENFDELAPILDIDLPYPFTADMFNLLKKENLYPQKYYFCRKKESYALFVTYIEKLNIFTYGKADIRVKVTVVGYPCSLCYPGYYTNDREFVFECVKILKGPVLVLNNDELPELKKVSIGETLPTCLLTLPEGTFDEYFLSMRYPYRRRINTALKNCRSFTYEITDNSPVNIHELYLNTYNKSDYKLEKLEKGFFENVDGKRIIYYQNGKPVSFTLLKKVDDTLIFMLCGMDYSIKTADLYFYMLYNIVKYAYENNCKYVDFGQTSENTKLKFGAVLVKKYYVAFHSNQVINMLFHMANSMFAYKYKFPEYHVFKETT